LSVLVRPGRAALERSSGRAEVARRSQSRSGKPVARRGRCQRPPDRQPARARDRAPRPGRLARLLRG